MKQYKAPAKVNIFLKITGKRGNYHEILSRFMQVPHLYDTLYFQAKEAENTQFEIIGDFSCATEHNTIFKAYKALQNYLTADSLVRLMQTHRIVVDKHIPAFAGLGGGSSDAATFLKMCNEVLHLGLSVEELSEVGAQVGADLPFFIHGYPAANVSGIGEIVKPFDEELLNLEIKTPNIEISTPAVYQRFRQDFYKELSANEIQKFEMLSSKEVLESLSISQANDLYEPALALYANLQRHYEKGWFFSGSGSSFFRLSEIKE